NTFTKSVRAKIIAASILISDVLPFGRLWYDTPDNAIGYAMHHSFRPAVRLNNRRLTGIPLESVLIAGRQIIRLREYSVSLNRKHRAPTSPCAPRGSPVHLRSLPALCAILR